MPRSYVNNQQLELTPTLYVLLEQKSVTYIF